MDTPVQYWDIDAADPVLESAIEGMDHRAVKVDEVQIVRRLNKDHDQISVLLHKAECFVGGPLRGVVADMGSGRGMLAALLSLMPGVERVYAIEYSKDHVLHFMPKTFERYRAESQKIIRCVGSFNRVKLPDASLDFILEYSAYHHSEDLPMTVAETLRLLRPGGWFIGLDRSWPSSTRQADLQKRLNKPLSRVQRELYQVPEGQPFTRADWGEHEYRDCDWLHVFARAGFESHVVRFQSFSRRTPAGFFRAMLFRFFGNALLRRRISGLEYYPWFMPGFNKALILCRKPEISETAPRDASPRAGDEANPAS